MEQPTLTPAILSELRRLLEENEWGALDELFNYHAESLIAAAERERWIPTHEKLPEESECVVIAHFDMAAIREAEENNEIGKDSTLKEVDICNVGFLRHWQARFVKSWRPLPPSPSEAHTHE